MNEKIETLARLVFATMPNGKTAQEALARKVIELSSQHKEDK